MPENAPLQNDRPLEAPSLLEMSAEVIANYAEHLLPANKNPLAYSQPSSSKTLTDLKPPQARVVGLRDPAAEQVAIEFFNL